MRRLDSIGASLQVSVFALTAAGGLTGCPSDDATNADTVGQISESNGSGEVDSTGALPVADSGSSGAADAPTSMGDDTPMETGSSDDSVTFIMNPDGGGINNECDIWAQDCPEGEKCMPYANDGSGSWNATRCSELNPNPAQIGDACLADGGGVSGIDDCDISGLCWDVDPETNVGVCAGFCAGTPDAPICEDPDTGCSISNDGVLALCLPFCDPLLQDCGEGGGCYPEAAGFFCSPDASGAEGGAYGDGCEYLNVCDPGLWCADASAVPGCNAAGCCSEFCDASDPAAVCMGVGQTCVSFWEEGEAPPGEEDYGLCLIEV